MALRSYLLVASVWLASLVSCASERSSLVQTRPEFKIGAHRVSVVGLFRHGRLDDATWQSIAPRVVQPFGSVNCASAYNRSLREADPDTYAALDRRIKEEGLSNEALAILVPYTQADLLLILDSRDPRVRAPRKRKDPTDLPGRPQRSGHARSATRTQEPTQNAHLLAGSGYSLTASLFSVSLQKLVARIDTHDHVTLDEAAVELSQNLRSLLAGSSCATWKWLENAPPEAAANVPGPAGADADDGAAGAAGAAGATSY
ncbi:MAG: hypothetical protein ACOY0T_20980 [Myxococcota bacterium]